MADALDWLRSHEELMWALGIAGAVFFVASLVALPWLVARIPVDYFAHRHREPRVAAGRPVLRLILRILKNIAGLLLVVAGIAMLVLPGQGILTILIGVLLLDFPGKYRLEQALVRRRSVLSTLNWIRAKANRPRLVMEEGGDDKIADTRSGSETRSE